MSSNTLIIDADVLVYKAAEASTQEFELDTQEDSEYLYASICKGHKQTAIDVLEKKIDDLTVKLKATDIVMVLSDDKANFRKTINPSYKGNRKCIKPILFNFIREYIQQNYKTYIRPTLEGDDVIGILMTSPKIIKGKKCSWSLDKDFKTIPGTFYQEKTNKSLEKHVITQEEADWWFMYQTLIGDTTDGYCGCKGIGDKTAQKILGDVGAKSLEDMWELVKQAYVAKGQTEEDALLQSRCARILRAEDYDFSKKEVKLWEM